MSTEKITKMTEFKLTIGTETGKTFKSGLTGPDAEKLIGKKIGEKFNGTLIGASGYELEITGGSDKSGFPMLPGIMGSGRKKPILSGGKGFGPKRKGERRRKTVTGNTISDSTSQINCKVIKKGKEDLSKVFKVTSDEAEAPVKEEPVEKKEEAPKAKEAPTKEEEPKKEEKTEAPEEKKEEDQKIEEKPSKEEKE